MNASFDFQTKNMEYLLKILKIYMYIKAAQDRRIAVISLKTPENKDNKGYKMYGTRKKRTRNRVFYCKTGVKNVMFVHKTCPGLKF